MFCPPFLPSYSSLRLSAAAVWTAASGSPFSGDQPAPRSPEVYVPLGCNCRLHATHRVTCKAVLLPVLFSLHRSCGVQTAKGKAWLPACLLALYTEPASYTKINHIRVSIELLVGAVQMHDPCSKVKLALRF